MGFGGVEGGGLARLRGGELAGLVDFVLDTLDEDLVEGFAALADLAGGVGDELFGALARQPGALVLP